MVLDMDNCSVMTIECEERRYCFQITSPNGRTLHQTALQAVTPITSFEKRAEGSPKTDRVTPGGVSSREPQKPLEPEDLIVPGTPIQFDICFLSDAQTPLVRRKMEEDDDDSDTHDSCCF
ncbi:DCC-interacting protein 13-beta-like isoform X2 [Carassius auratus]|uniref:DCC-interacting protein 13-beta-like isoform X2 n=1 Tax=Carassius auratus TaxID=7957 RepID=A0A6P6MD12_CARAU|nr:DCC-interacting protein 13-beta-like isoform X2 [Carassius auratus]